MKKMMMSILLLLAGSSAKAGYYQCGCDLGDGSVGGYAEYSNVTYAKALAEQQKYCGKVLWELPVTRFNDRAEADQAGIDAAHCEVWQ